MAISKIHNLRYRDHTLPYFVKSSILQLPELVEHTTLCYIQLGIHQNSPYNIKALWNIREQTRTNLRDREIMLDYPVSQKEYINTLPAVVQAKIWNNQQHDKDVKEGKPQGQINQPTNQQTLMQYLGSMDLYCYVILGSLFAPNFFSRRSEGGQRPNCLWTSSVPGAGKGLLDHTCIRPHVCIYPLLTHPDSRCMCECRRASYPKGIKIYEAKLPPLRID